MSKILVDNENCPPVDENVDSETDLVINEAQELAQVKRPVGRPKKYLDPNHKYPNNYPRKNLYKHCEVCNKTCEYYHYKHHVKSRYHVKRIADIEAKNTNTNEEIQQTNNEQIVNLFRTLIISLDYDQFTKSKEKIIKTINDF